LILTSELGIREWNNAITFIDNANALINNSIVDLWLDNNLNITRWQNGAGRIYRADGVRPVLNPPTDAGLDALWQLPVLSTTSGSGPLTLAQDAQLFALPSAANVVDEWETQSQADPTGFQVNIKEVNDVVITGAGAGTDTFGPA
jgi:hypothetical protein